MEKKLLDDAEDSDEIFFLKEMLNLIEHASGNFSIANMNMDLRLGSGVNATVVGNILHNLNDAIDLYSETRDEAQGHYVEEFEKVVNIAELIEIRDKVKHWSQNPWSVEWPDVYSRSQHSLGQFAAALKTLVNGRLINFCC